MKLRWKLTLGLVAVGILTAVTLWRRATTEQRALDQTRRELHQQGFKIDLAEFDFSAPEEFHARITALTNATIRGLPRNHTDAALRSLLEQIMPPLMQPVSADSAIPLWKQETWPVDPGAATYLQLAELPNDLWLVLRQDFNENRRLLDQACAAALAGPIRVPLNASHGNSMLLPYLATWKNLTQTLGGRVAVELHNGNLAAAWTNVLAATRLTTAWQTEPLEISQLVRASCVAINLNIIWQALQTNGWTDEQLSQLQREWESVDFFKALPETAAFGRACAAASCQREREETYEDSEPMLKELLRSPRQAWANLSNRYQRLRYRQHGSYEVEKELLLYYRNREQQLQQATPVQTWTEMRQLPGVTNTAPFTLSKRHPSSTVAMLNSRQLSLAWMMYSSPGQGNGLLGRAAVAESHRRLIVTSIALERFHNRRGAYPKSLAELAPEFARSPPVDFMDGKPLRYRLTDDGHFLLYSVGLDGVNNGGEMRLLPRSELPSLDPHRAGTRVETDLVWPRPASSAEVASYRREQIKALADETERKAEAEAEYQWNDTASRQAQVGKILAAKPASRSPDPQYHGRPLADTLANQSDSVTNNLKLADRLILRQIPTDAEPETITFEVPICYEALTNLGQLALLVDPIEAEDFWEDCQASWAECHRATNGNCLLMWNTIYESPGPHALQLGLVWNDPTREDETFATGPLALVVVSNLCQFSLNSAYFKPELDATLRAKLLEPNAAYSLEITLPTGELLKTITGSTSNGLMTIHWDLVDDRGVRRTNSAFNTLIKVNLLDSGRTQTLKGP
jgi:hypothetical protein